MIEQTVVDGIPTLVAPSSGPARGGITFRVGQADETLARSGITHLVEHLALYRLGLTDYHYNGATGSTVTHFFSQGSPEGVGEYLNSVCAALTDLPWNRVDMEKEILRTEAAGKSHSPAEPLLLWRYGARGYGVSSYPEWGLAEISADDVRMWVAQYFTRENAVLWFGGTTPPANLRLDLPTGARMPLPAMTSALASTPAWFEGPPRAVAFHSHVPRSSAAMVYSDVLERELFRSLRQEGAYSYTASTGYEPIDPDTAAIVAIADAHPEKQDAALGGFIDVLAKLRWGTIEQNDVDATLAKAREALRDPEVDANRLPAAAFNLLTGGPLHTVDEVLRELDEVTIARLHEIAEEVVSNGLLMAPEGRQADWAGFTAAPTSSTEVVSGMRYPMHGDSEHALVLGTQGVSVTNPGGPATVHFAQCSVMLAWPDGGRMLIGHDAITCRVEPTLFPVDAAALSALDAALPAATVVRMPARDPDTIPQPPDTTARTKPSRAKPPSPATSMRFRRLTIVALIVLGIVAVTCGLFSALTTVSTFTEPSDAETWTRVIVVLMFWGATAFVVTLCALLIRRLRR